MTGRAGLAAALHRPGGRPQHIAPLIWRNAISCIIPARFNWLRCCRCCTAAAAPRGSTWLRGGGGTGGRPVCASSRGKKWGRARRCGGQAASHSVRASKWRRSATPTARRDARRAAITSNQDGSWRRRSTDSATPPPSLTGLHQAGWPYTLGFLGARSRRLLVFPTNRACAAPVPCCRAGGTMRTNCRSFLWGRARQRGLGEAYGGRPSFVRKG